MFECYIGLECHNVSRAIDYREIFKYGLVHLHSKTRAGWWLDAAVFADDEDGAEHVAKWVELRDAGFEVAGILGGGKKMQACSVVQACGRTVRIDGDAKSGCQGGDSD